jgi:glycosyltransferase involved in cell wall biosynthesis
MKILHIIPVYEPAWIYGGPVRSVSLLCRELANLGGDITVYTTTANGGADLPANPDQPIDLGGVKVFRFPLQFRLNYFFSPEMALSIRNTIRSFDLIHITSIWNYPGLPAAREARKQGIPYLYSARGSLHQEDYPGVWRKNLKKSLYYRLLLDGNFQHASAIHFTAKMEWEQSMSLVGHGLPGFIIPNGIDCNEFDHLPNRAEGLRSLGGLPENARIVSYLGRLHPQKALDVLIRAFKPVSERFPDIFLLLGGPDGGHETFLRSLVADLGMGTHVRFLGLLNSEQRRLLLGCTDIFTLTGYGENFGMAVVEAMAAGLPVIVSDNVCIHENIVTDKAGVSVPVDEAQIGSALIELLSNPEKLRQMGKAAYVSTRKRYEKQFVASQMAVAYQDILSGRRSSDCEWIL